MHLIDTRCRSCGNRNTKFVADAVRMLGRLGFICAFHCPDCGETTRRLGRWDAFVPILSAVVRRILANAILGTRAEPKPSRPAHDRHPSALGPPGP